MPSEVGAVFEGKVTGITKFGAFVTMPDGKSGLVHISEIANTYVSDVHDYLQEGQTVKVKVLSIGDGGKVNLSIKRAESPENVQPERQQFSPRRPVPQQGARRECGYQSAAQRPAQEAKPEPSFEDKLKQFMQESDSRMSGNKLYADRKNTSRRRRD